VDQQVAALSAKERRDENRKTRDKMKLVRSQMESCSLLKQKKDNVRKYSRRFSFFLFSNLTLEY